MHAGPKPEGPFEPAPDTQYGRENRYRPEVATMGFTEALCCW